MIEDYSYLYKEILPSNKTQDEDIYDFFISTFTKAERTQTVFARCSAKQKHWLIIPEYCFADDDLPSVENGNGEYSHHLHYQDDGMSAIQEFWKGLKIDDKKTVCIDATGFLRPSLLFLMMLIHKSDIKKYDILYAEPNVYADRERTQFSSNHTIVKQVPGFEGEHNPGRVSNDLLVVGAGYEDKLLTSVAEDKKHAKKVLIYGFPSLQADMFQENVLRVSRAEEAVGAYDPNMVIFAAANDPFATANAIRKIVREHERDDPVFNLYLSPLSTKPQVVGFGLYYITERLETATSIIFPFASNYEPETSKGIGRIWRYTIEIPES